MKTTVTDEQIAAASAALMRMHSAGKELYAIMTELGWDELDDGTEIKAAGGDQFVQDMFGMLDACICPGWDILSCAELSGLLDRELSHRNLNAFTKK